ncbi:hypothetical protein Ccrd_020631 [Cynara cardunculus var. scolymus]|uniref:Uncharacterized protein n=1 Tax=Cynara cardunculus var. scolymus TaxID=59895 RepID=A0A124SET4_CYNCS|nr:hypothetical protein Ccrd_020631 [Cynara cardunculus var. scolymus]
MDLRTRKIGGKLELKQKVVAAGVKKKEKQAYLVEERAGKMIVVLMWVIIRLVIEHLPLIGGLMLVTAVLGMRHDVTVNGHLGGVQTR